MKISEVALGSKYVHHGDVAISYSRRRRGLSNMAIEDSPDALLFERCRSIHTFGMKFDLLVLFLDKQSTILSSRIVPPNRVVFGPIATRSIVEIPYGE